MLNLNTYFSAQKTSESLINKDSRRIPEARPPFCYFPSVFSPCAGISEKRADFFCARPVGRCIVNAE